jgi:transcriptional regulator of acetoin/glycerol metabolism
MWVQDQSSRNGTYVRGHQETTFLVVPGDTFIVATTRLLVVNENMRLARSSMAEVLGYDFDSGIDDLLIYSVQDRPLLIIGPTGAGQLDLVRAVHETSVRRDRELVVAHRVPAAREKQKQLVAGAQRGTLVLQVTGRPVDRMFLDMVLSSDLHVRLVVLARSLQVASRSVDLDTLTRMDMVEIRPLQERQGDIGKLMDEQFRKSDMALTMKDLTIGNQRALQAHDWAQNLDEIRRAARNVLAIVRAGSIRRAAQSLHLPRSSLQYWLDRMQMRTPLISGESPAPRETSS